MSQNSQEYATLEICVTTCSGILPVKGAAVTVRYDGMSFDTDGQITTHITDEDGRTQPFLVKMRRARIGGKDVDFPRNKGCSVSVKADGYVLCKARDIPIFSGITVKRSFDLLPISMKSDA